MVLIFDRRSHRRGLAVFDGRGEFDGLGGLVGAIVKVGAA